MITPRGHVKIADFGIALATQDFSKKLTSTGEFVGTPGYLSPEVCLGKTVDQRSDIFALGIVLYEMLSGSIPFTDESPLGLMLEVVKAEIPDIRGLNADVDPQTAEILGRMLAKEPSDRFQDCHELSAALQAHPLVAKGGTVQLSRPKAAPSDATVVGAPTPASQPQRVPTPPPVVGRSTPGSQPGPAAPPPAPAAEASTQASAQAARPSMLDRQDGRRRGKAPLWVAAAALVLLVGAAFAFRGAIGEFLVRSDDPAIAGPLTADPGASGSSTAESAAPASAQPVPGEDTAGAATTLSSLTSASSGSDAVTDAGDTGVERADPGAASSDGAALAGESLPPPSGPQSEPESATSEPRSPLAKALLAKREGEGTQLARVDPPKPAAKPVPPRVAVVALGDRALSDTAKQRLEERLLAEGFDVLDTELVGGLAGRDLPGILQSLRREATMLVVVRADPIGQQQLSAYGEYFTLYSANLSVRSYLIGDRRPLSAGFREKVDFSTMNVNEMTGEALAPHLSTLVRELVPHRSRSAAG
jgi:serine/threonine-protein kinase